ncbi:MAG: hypothetical protein ACI93T_001442, partial [Porticoccaceae bacterium]
SAHTAAKWQPTRRAIEFFTTSRNDLHLNSTHSNNFRDTHQRGLFTR